MAQMRYSNIPELKEFILNENCDFGRGAFGVVEELKILDGWYPVRWKEAASSSQSRSGGNHIILL